MAFIPPTGSFLELLNENCDNNVPTDDGQVQAMLKKYAVTFKKGGAKPIRPRELLADIMWIHANHEKFSDSFPRMSGAQQLSTDHCYSS